MDRSNHCRRCETKRVGDKKKENRGTLDRSKEADEAKRERVRDHLTNNPDDTADKAIGEACGCSAQTVEKVRADHFFAVRLWDQDDLIRELLACYEKLDADLRAELPLKRIWIVNPAEGD